MSDLTETRVGTITANEDRYVAWKSINGNYSETEHADWKTMLDGMLPKERLIDIVRNFICFNDSSDKIVKILAGYHQYFAVRKAVERAVEAVAGNGKIGVFWHTQGSGKSLSMVFFAHLVQQRLDSPTIVVITDRNDLDDQLYAQFGRCKGFLRQEPVKAKSRQNLKDLLVGREANGIVFTTMQKFTDGDEPLCDRRNVIVMVDEAHRGQYGLAERMDEHGKVSVGAARHDAQGSAQRKLHRLHGHAHRYRGQEHSRGIRRLHRRIRYDTSRRGQRDAPRLLREQGRRPASRPGGTFPPRRGVRRVCRRSRWCQRRAEQARAGRARCNIRHTGDH